MTRSPLFLAALASAAVPGLDPVSVEGLRPVAGSAFDVAYVTDSQERRWVIKAPRSQAAGAELAAVGALAPLLGRRLDIAMPMVRGEVSVPEGRAIVYLRLPGRPIDFASLPPGALSAGVGKALAHIHNLELSVFEEAGRPTYDAESHRRRQLSELDRGAATGHVPTNLLTRWEQRLEDISLWRFAPTPVHGSFVGDNVLASFDDEESADDGHVRGVLAWEASRVGDPADDFADLVQRAQSDVLDAVLRAYTQSRVERPDGNLLARARLAAEMTPMRVLLRSLAAGDRDLVEAAAEALRDLDERTLEEDEQRAVAADRDSESVLRNQPGPAAGPAQAPDPVQAPETAPEPAWDATQPHQPFPDPSVTQAINTDAPSPERPLPVDSTPGQSAPQSGPDDDLAADRRS